jgi:hypothetical protein
MEVENAAPLSTAAYVPNHTAQHFRFLWDIMAHYSLRAQHSIR